MRNVWWVIWIIVAIVCVMFANAYAQQSIEDKPLKIATGNAKSTYSMMVKDILPYCSGIEEYSDTTGGFQNVYALMKKKSNLAIIPEDVLERAARDDLNVEKNIRALMGMHFNSLHIIVLRTGVSRGGGGWLSKFGLGSEERMTIRDLRDLDKQKVACFGSAIVTAEFLAERLKIMLNTVEVQKPDDGLKMLRDGEVVALLATAGWPIEWVDNLDGNIYTLASMDETNARKIGEPYKVVKLNYQKLGAMGIISIGPRNLLSTLNYTGQKMTKKVLDFRECLLQNLQDIKEGNSHPSWGDVTDENDFKWKRYNPEGERAAAEILKRTQPQQ